MKNLKIKAISVSLLFFGLLFMSGINNFVLADDPPIVGRCFPDSSIVSIGQQVSWVADFAGGSGFYRYDWIGTDNLSGGGWTVNKIYDKPGLKTATVRVNSGTKQAVRSCTVTVNSTIYNQGQVLGDFAHADFSARCFATPSSVRVGEKVVWTVIAAGGSGGFSYSWTGTDSLSGNLSSVEKIYNIPGQKSATVSVVSGGQRTSASCVSEILDNNSVSTGQNQNSNDGNNNLSNEGAGGEVVNTGRENGDEKVNTNDRFNGWKFLALGILFIGTAILLIFIFIMRKQSKIYRQKISSAYASNSNKNNGKNGKSDVAEIIQEEARNRQVLLSTDALKLLSDKSEGDANRAIKCLDCVVSEIKEPPAPTVFGEERLPVVGKEEVEKCFLRNKDL